MANDTCARLTPGDGSSLMRGMPPGTLNTFHSGLCAVGLGVGVPLPPKLTGAILYPLRVPNAVGLVTGLTVELMVADDPMSRTGGLKAYFGVTVAPIVSGTTTFDEAAFAGSTEVKAQLTMPAVPGAILVGSIDVPIADMNSLAAGGSALVRVRRIGGNALDTDPGRVVLLNVELFDMTTPA